MELGWRFGSLDALGYVHGQYAGWRWQSREKEALCLPGFTPEHDRPYPLSAQEAEKHLKAGTCTCGLYVLDRPVWDVYTVYKSIRVGDLEDIRIPRWRFNHNEWGCPASISVSYWGAVSEHKSDEIESPVKRVQFARIEAIVLPDDVDTMRLIAARIAYNVPVMRLSEYAH